MISYIYEGRTHQFDGVSVCLTQVGHQCVLDISTPRLRHMILHVPFKKYYFPTRTRVGYDLNVPQM